LPVAKFRHLVVCIEDYSDFAQRIKLADVQVIALHRSKVGVWKLRWELFKLCHKLKPSLVHSRNQSGLDVLLPARLAGIRYCIHGEHGWDVDNLDGKNWKQLLLKRLHSPLVSHFITVSKDIKQHLINRVGVESSRITQIYNGVDTHKFAPVDYKRIDFLPLNFQMANCILIGTVGRLQPVKDQATLLRAFSQLINNNVDLAENVRLVIVGNGPLLTELQKLAVELNVSDKVWFSKSVDYVTDILKALDLYVQPSLNEGISNTILEAMSTGLPVIATAVGGNTELVYEDITGSFFDPKDINTLANLLYDYCKNEQMRKLRGLAARKVVEQHYSLTRMMADYEACYDKVFENDMKN
jgi:sugar transferase (PEP-CTERM/EpsH1 system associated)